MLSIKHEGHRAIVPFSMDFFEAREHPKAFDLGSFRQGEDI
jgi:hypothetical protein